MPGEKRGKGLQVGGSLCCFPHACPVGGLGGVGHISACGGGDATGADVTDPP